MSELTVVGQATGPTAAPATGRGKLFFDSASKSFWQVDDAGNKTTLVGGGAAAGQVVLMKPAGTTTSYSTIAAAITAAAGGDTILIGPGTWAEDFIIPSGVVVMGYGLFTIINGSDIKNTRIFASGTLGGLYDLTVRIPSNATPAITSGITAFSVKNVHLTGTLGGALGYGLEVSAGVTTVRDLSYSGTACVRVVSVSGGAADIDGLTIGSTSTTGLYCAAGVATARSVDVSGATEAVTVTGTGSVSMYSGPLGGTTCVRLSNDTAAISLTSITMAASSTTHVLVDGGVSLAQLGMYGCSYDSDKISCDAAWFSQDVRKIASWDVRSGDEGFNINKELHVGEAGFGREATIGEGESYTKHMMVLTTDNTAGAGADGGNLTDVTAAAASASGSTFTFQGNGANYSILAASTMGLKHWGWKVAVTTGAAVGAGRFAFEIWDGAAWAEVGSMSNDATDFSVYGNSAFLRINSEHIRFGADSTTTWVSKAINGLNAYWARVRIIAGITTEPVIEQLKLSPSRFEANEDGTNTYHGLSRFRPYVLSAGNIFGETGAVVSASVSVGSGAAPGGWMHDSPNSLLNNVSDAMYWQVSLPNNIDTSFPCYVTAICHSAPGGAAPSPTLVCSLYPAEVAGNMVADPAGGTATIARSVASTVAITASAAQSDSQTCDATATAKLVAVTFGPFDIVGLYAGDWALCRLELDVDGTPNQDIWVAGVELVGVAWRHGGKL